MMMMMMMKAITLFVFHYRQQGVFGLCTNEMRVVLKKKRYQDAGNITECVCIC